MKHVMAFDVSMGKSTMVIYDCFGQCEFEGEIEHTSVDFDKLRDQLQHLTKQDGQQPEIIFEATGVYSQSLERFFQENNYDYYRVNPLEAKIQTASMRRQKTDISDAHELAKSHFRFERRKTYIQDEYYQQMRALNRYYDEVIDEIQFLFNRMHALIQLSFPQFEKVFSKSSILFLNMIQHYPHPDLVKECSPTSIGEKIREATGK
ncbi:IS110 family transposase, partial [Solibacillus silvestris]|uniref:IS110 family transposase n=1 Tax=Solibacillus silvestris TaxID=76853 RepID=UPI003F81ED1A